MPFPATWQDPCGCRGIFRTDQPSVRITDVACSAHVTAAFDERASSQIRKYDTGATRDADNGKLKYEGFISPLVEKRFAEYMHLHRQQKDGSLRAPDNWQRGIPLDDYADSLIRHVQDFRLHVDGFGSEAVSPDIEDVLCAIRFNVDGYLFEILKNRTSK